MGSPRTRCSFLASRRRLAGGSAASAWWTRRPKRKPSICLDLVHWAQSAGPGGRSQSRAGVAYVHEPEPNRTPMRSQPSRVHAARTRNAKEVSFMSRLAVIAVLALGAPATALAHGASATHKSVANEKGQHRLVLGGNVASIDGSAKAAVLSLGGSRGKLVTLDLSHTSVRLVSKHGRAKAGALADVHAEDRVFVDLTVSAKVAHADATAGVSVPVKRLIDEGVPSSRAATRFENPTVSGLVQIVA